MILLDKLFLVREAEIGNKVKVSKKLKLSMSFCEKQTKAIVR